MRYLQKLFLHFTIIILIILSGINCNRNSGNSKRDPNTVVIYMDSYESGGEWCLSPEMEDTPKMLVFLPLVKFEDKHDWYEGIRRPGLALRWEHSADYRVWTFYLNPATKWDDGIPVTAHDVKFTFDLWMHPEVMYAAVKLPEKVTVVDDHTVKIEYLDPFSEILSGWEVYYPKHLLEDLEPKDFFKWDFWTHPVGNGPYRYVRHVPDTMMEFEANPDYILGKPRIERIILRFSGASRIFELLSGGVDVVHKMDPKDILRLNNHPQFKVYHGYTPSFYSIYWNHRNPLFRDSSIRKALAMAINRRELHGMAGNFVSLLS